MPRQKQNKGKKNNKKTNKKTNKKSLTKTQYNAVKKIAYNVSNSPKNKEWYKVKTPFYINNNVLLYQPDPAPAYNGYELVNGNFKFYPLTNLGIRVNDIQNQYIPNEAFLNLKANNWLIDWVNSGASDPNEDRYAHFSGRKVSINSIQVKGVFEVDNHTGTARPGRMGFRIVRGGINEDKGPFTNLAQISKITPSIDDVYNGMKNYVIADQDDVDKLTYAYNKQMNFNKKYPTVLKKYTYISETDLNKEHLKRTFNVFHKFKKPLELVYPQGAVIGVHTATDTFYMSLKNNLFFCPFFSSIDDTSTPGSTKLYNNTNYALSDAGTFKIYGQIVINYTDS